MRLLLALSLAAFLPAQDVTPQRLAAADKEPQNWLTYGGTYNAQRFSPLDQINRANVRRMVPVWSFQTGDAQGGMQCTPLVADGVMYISTSLNKVFALDAASGRKLWGYFYEKPKAIAPLYGPWNRGVAIGHGMVYIGTNDNHLVALDAKTGRETWNVNVEDVVSCGCNITGAPLLVKDKVVVGTTAGDSAHRGYINAFDATTGRQAWRFWTIPGPRRARPRNLEGRKLENRRRLLLDDRVLRSRPQPPLLGSRQPRRRLLRRLPQRRQPLYRLRGGPGRRHRKTQVVLSRSPV